MVDEMELLRQLKDATPPRDEAYERAWTTLCATLAEPASVSEPETVPSPGARLLRKEKASWASRRRSTFGIGGKVGIGAGIGVVAAGVAIVLVATSTPRSAAPTGKPSGTPAGSTAQAPAVDSKLVTLAADIKASGGTLPGDSSLSIETQVIGGKLMQVEYGLYTDNGALYSGDSNQTLTMAVREHANLAEGVNTKEMAAAIYAANGNLATARVRMVEALPGGYEDFLNPAARKQAYEKELPEIEKLLREKGSKAAPPKMLTGAALQVSINQGVWSNAVDALNWGAANPQIRAGVLRLLATIPQVTTAKSVTGGQSTLTITGTFPDYTQALTVSAQTGIPLSSVVTIPKIPTSVETFKVSRVSLAAVKAGKF